MTISKTYPARVSAISVGAVALLLLGGLTPANATVKLDAGAVTQDPGFTGFALDEPSCAAGDNLNQIADTFISRCRKASIRREFPGSHLTKTVRIIKADSTAIGKKAWKLLNDSRFMK